MKFKAIVLDLDGTLTNNKKEITPRTKAALMAAQEKGAKIVLASGRPTFGIAPLAEELELQRFGGYILAFNGGRITDWATREVVYNQILDPALVPVIYRAAMENDFEVVICQDEVLASTDVSDPYVKHEAFINKMPLVQYDDFLTQVKYPLNKCLVVGDPARLAVFDKAFASEMEGRMGVYRSCDFFLECVPLGIDKAASLARLFSMIGIEMDDVIACGDANNDLSMIKAAGLGVAMANASPECLEAADFVTLSNEEDGVAHVVEHFVLKDSL